MTDAAPALTDLHERPTLEFAFDGSGAGYHLFGELNPAPKTKPYFSIPQSVFDPARPQGDVDMFMAHPRWPDRTTAIEAKRIKITPHLLMTNRMGKLGGLRKGVAQANSLRAIGFHRVFFLVVLVVDLRGAVELRPRDTDRFRNALLRKDALADLDSRVGLAVLELAQPEDVPVTQHLAFGHRVFKPGRRQRQADTLTERVRSFLGQDEFWKQTAQHR